MNDSLDWRHEVMVACSVTIIHWLSSEPLEMAAALFSKFLINNATLDETVQLNETHSQKGRRLYSAVLQVVKIYPDRYDDFISVLQQCGSLMYGDLLQELEAKSNYLHLMFFRETFTMGPGLSVLMIYTPFAPLTI